MILGHSGRPNVTKGTLYKSWNGEGNDGNEGTRKDARKGRSERFNVRGGLGPPPWLGLKMKEAMSQGMWLVSRS